MIPQRWIIVGVILAAQTVANIGPLGIPAIASLIRGDLGLSLTQAGSFLSAYYIGPILMSFPAGTMADQWGIARTLILGQVVIGIGLLAVSASGSYGILIVLMVLAGFGYGMLNPTSTKAVLAWSPPRARATVVGLSLLAAGRYLALAQVAGMAGRIAFGVLSDRAFGGRRRAPLIIAGTLSTLCTLGIAFTGAMSSALWLSTLVLAFGFAGIGWNGVQHTWMAELAGPTAAGTAVGLGLAVSSAGVALGPLIFGRCVEPVGDFRGPWIGLAVTMVAAMALLTLVRERRRDLYG